MGRRKSRSQEVFEAVKVECDRCVSLKFGASLFVSLTQRPRQAWTLSNFTAQRVIALLLRHMMDH